MADPPTTPGPPFPGGPDGQPLAEQPSWRREFPVDLGEERRVNRRQLLRCACIGGAAVAAAAGLAPDAVAPAAPGTLPRRRIAEPAALAMGEARLFDYPDERHPCLLLRIGSGSAGLVAFSQLCTHLMCPVIPQPEQQRLYCPCHAGAFDIGSGEPLQGPPRRRLPRILLEHDEAGVWAVGIG